MPRNIWISIRMNCSYRSKEVISRRLNKPNTWNTTESLLILMNQFLSTYERNKRLKKGDYRQAIWQLVEDIVWCPTFLSSFASPAVCTQWVQIKSELQALNMGIRNDPSSENRSFAIPSKTLRAKIGVVLCSDSIGIKQNRYGIKTDLRLDEKNGIRSFKVCNTSRSKKNGLLLLTIPWPYEVMSDSSHSAAWKPNMTFHQHSKIKCLVHISCFFEITLTVYG